MTKTEQILKEVLETKEYIHYRPGGMDNVRMGGVSPWANKIEDFIKRGREQPSRYERLRASLVKIAAVALAGIEHIDERLKSRKKSGMVSPNPHNFMGNTNE